MRILAPLLLATALTAQEAVVDRKPIKLPAPKMGTFTLDKALKERKSDRSLTGPALSLQELSQLLWSAQGENRPKTNRRTVPSASARYPLELYVVVSKGEKLAEGVYSYLTKDHTITRVRDGNPESFFGPLEHTPPWVLKTPAVFIVAGVSSRMKEYFDDPQNKDLYTFWESGAAAQALIMQATALGLGSTVVLGTDLPGVVKSAGMPEDHRVSVIIPVGRIAKQ